LSSSNLDASENTARSIVAVISLDVSRLGTFYSQ